MSARKSSKSSADERLVAAASIVRDLKQRSNEAFFPMYFDQHRYLVLKGGGGSGKSIFAGSKIIERCRREPGHRILVCRKVARTLRESCFQQLIGQCSELGLRVKINKSDMGIEFDNGSELLFAGLDDVEKLKSIYNITGIWIEEASELLEADFNQLDIRLRGETKYYKQIILTFNPISIQHWLKKRFFDARDDRTFTHESTYKDNRFLDEEAIKTLEGFKETDEYYYAVYCLGEWGTSGRSVFNAKEVQRRLSEHIKPVKVGYFEFDYDGLTVDNIRWTDDPHGFVHIYADVEKNVPYVIGGDTAGDGSDSFVGQVIDNRSGAQVATLRHQFDEDVYARQIYCLGKYYNDALVGIETNFSTYPNMEMERLRYPNLYVRDSIDNFTHQVRKAYGFRTDAKTRPVIISGLIQATRDDMDIVSDETTLMEMLTFVRNEDFKPEAEAGAHDDCVMALAIAHYIRPQQSYLEKADGKTAKWTDGMWEDFRNCSSKEERDYLIKKWGRPN